MKIQLESVQRIGECVDLAPEYAILIHCDDAGQAILMRQVNPVLSNRDNGMFDAGLNKIVKETIESRPGLSMPPELTEKLTQLATQILNKILPGFMRKEATIALQAVLSQEQDMQGKDVVQTTGGTTQPVRPKRQISPKLREKWAKLTEERGQLLCQTFEETSQLNLSDIAALFGTKPEGTNHWLIAHKADLNSWGIKKEKSIYTRTVSPGEVDQVLVKPSETKQLVSK